MLDLTRFIGAFEITNWLWEDVWVVCFWKGSCIPATFGGWTTNLLELVNFTIKRRIFWRDFLDQKAWMVHCGKNFENSLLSTIKMILLTMKFFGTECQSLNPSKTKVSWSSQLVGSVGISVAQNIWLNFTLWKCCWNTNLKAIFFQMMLWRKPNWLEWESVLAWNRRKLPNKMKTFWGGRPECEKLQIPEKNSRIWKRPWVDLNWHTSWWQKISMTIVDFFPLWQSHCGIGIRSNWKKQNIHTMHCSILYRWHRTGIKMNTFVRWLICWLLFPHLHGAVPVEHWMLPKKWWTWFAILWAWGCGLLHDTAIHLNLTVSCFLMILRSKTNVVLWWNVNTCGCLLLNRT